VLEVSQAGQTGKAADFRHREAQQGCRAMFANLFLDIRAHLQVQTLDKVGEHVAIQIHLHAKCFIMCDKPAVQSPTFVHLRSSLHK
jgi:hypothetical protein